MGTTLIIACSNCGNLSLAPEKQKTKTCPYCGTHIDVRKAKKLASAKNAFDASQMLQNIKRRKSFT